MITAAHKADLMYGLEACKKHNASARGESVCYGDGARVADRDAQTVMI